MKTNMESILVSVIIPCYNVAKYIARCLDSIINQTLKELEIIVIDDNSTDLTISIVKKFCLQDKRIKLVRLKKNHGAAYARNIGINMSSGLYLSFIDADDYIDSNFYERLCENGNQADIIKGGATGVQEISNFIRKNKVYFYAQWWSALYKRSLIQKYRIRFPRKVFCGQDFVFQRLAIFRAQTIYVEDSTYYHYLKRPYSLDSAVFSVEKMESQLLARWYIISHANQLLKDSEDFKIVVHRLFSEIEWLWRKAGKNKDSKWLICANYIFIYQKMRHKKLLYKLYPTLYAYMASRDVGGLYRHLSYHYMDYKYILK